MMREIKFRFWNITDKSMVYDLMFKVEPAYRGMDSNIRVCSSPGYEVMQYTGLKDKNGKEIFEGDIVKSTHFKREEVVKFVNGAFMIKSNTGSGHTLLSWWWSRGTGIEVIGNIYENPELLKEAPL